MKLVLLDVLLLTVQIIVGRPCEVLLQTDPGPNFSLVFFLELKTSVEMASISLVACVL